MLILINITFIYSEQIGNVSLSAFGVVSVASNISRKLVERIFFEIDA